MIKTIVELYGELERFKNYAQELLNELETIGKGESRRFKLLLNDVVKFITEWRISGLNYLNIDFDPRIEALLIYASNCVSDMEDALNNYKVKSLLKDSLKEFLKYINETQKHISERYTKDEDLYSNRVLQSQFNKLMELYDYFLYVLTRKKPSEPTEKVSLEDYDRSDVTNFVDKFVEFANALNINVTPRAFYSLIEPMFEKQTYEQYTQRVNTIKEMVEFYINEMKERINQLNINL